MTSTIDYQALFRNSPNAYFVISTNYEIRDTNDAHLRLVGRTRDELVGRNLFDVFPADPEGANPDQARQLKASLDRVFETGEPGVLAVIRYAIPISTVEGDGFRDEFWSVSHHPILDADGRSGLLFLHVQNVSKLRGSRSDEMPEIICRK